MGAGDEDLGAAGGVSDLDHVDLDAVALVQRFGFDALVWGKHGLGILAVGGDADGDTAVSGLDLGDDTGQDLMLLGSKLLIDDAALGLADALDDDLLGGLGGDAPELLCLHGDMQLVADLGALVDLLGGLENDLVAGVLDLLHDGLDDVHLDALFILLEDDFHIVLALGIVAPEGGKHGLPDLVVHIVAGNALFFFDVLYCLKKICIHFL